MKNNKKKTYCLMSRRWKYVPTFGISALLIVILCAFTSNAEPQEVAKAYWDASLAMDMQMENALLADPVSEEDLNRGKDLLQSQVYNDYYDSKYEYIRDRLQKRKEAHKSTKYELVKVDRKGDEAIITVQITDKDYEKAMAKALEPYRIHPGDNRENHMLIDDFQDMLRSAILKSMDHAEDITYTVDLHLVLIDREWKIENQSADQIDKILWAVGKLP